MTQIPFRMFVTPTPEGNVSGNANKGNKFLFVLESSLQAQKNLICPYLSHSSEFEGQTKHNGSHFGEERKRRNLSLETCSRLTKWKVMIPFLE